MTARLQVLAVVDQVSALVLVPVWVWVWEAMAAAARMVMCPQRRLPALSWALLATVLCTPARPELTPTLPSPLVGKYTWMMMTHSPHQPPTPLVTPRRRHRTQALRRWLAASMAVSP